MINKGMHQYRFNENTLEQKFAELWEESNVDIDGGPTDYGVLNYLLAQDNNRPFSNEVTPRDREVAATVIQWLGSPVGQNFLKNVLSERCVFL